ncbi:biotin--[acetyl-CoA-carboxylase] ligase [Cellulomonas palmilytica]|uniref:biotin--[acetyl-CoA-carboxylase] ligase n=1 Tax=Cellulomonas palmilytica TaxID=2608402 RepID=UPI001F2CA8A6|nr:biotin--[acetyl-CoA-carboxylase] ligase [Cellulomonas palmilytica]UJP41267.1 biotin--[acetyl-CoA-carboxylase] ligase [Cellulomonas palmilytica]
MTTRPALDPDEVRALLQQPHGPLARVEVVATTGSTNADVVRDLRADPASWPDRSLLVADHQVAGRGRRDRTWQTPAGTAVTCSFVVHLDMPADRYGWLPLLAGLGAVRAVRATAGVAASLKWPNDVLVPASSEVEGWGPARKVGGVLSELVPLADGTTAAVVGIGLNVLQAADELPVPSAGSLALAGARHVDRLAVLVGLVEALEAIETRWDASGGAVHDSGLADEVASVLSTLGTGVAVDLPGGDVVEGVAVRLDDDGALVVRTAADDERRVLAGDVRHLRALA